MGWFKRKPSNQKQVGAIIKVATNLYLQTISEAADAPGTLQFGLPDSRFRYLIFCLSATVTAVLAYDEKREFEPEVLINGCLNFGTWTATDNAEEFLSAPLSPQDAATSANAHLQEFLKRWMRWVELEQEGRNAEIIDLICSMIHTTESNMPNGEPDIQRLGELALSIDCRLLTMRNAFIELVH